MRIRPPKVSGKKIYVFPDGARSVSTGGIYISNTIDTPSEVIDISEATEEEFHRIRKNPKDQKLINELTRKKK